MYKIRILSHYHATTSGLKYKLSETGNYLHLLAINFITI